MKKLFKRNTLLIKPGQSLIDDEGLDFEISHTPITKYKTRR